MTFVATAETVEETVHEQFRKQYAALPESVQFALPESELYGVTMSEAGTELTLVETNADVYELLAVPSSERKLSFSMWAVITTGWAAPLNPNGEVDGAPSAHPERRRVRLTIIATANDVASVIRFDNNEKVADPGAATGNLADAISYFATA